MHSYIHMYTVDHVNNYLIYMYILCMCMPNIKQPVMVASDGSQ